MLFASCPFPMQAAAARLPGMLVDMKKAVLLGLMLGVLWTLLVVAVAAADASGRVR